MDILAQAESELTFPPHSVPIRLPVDWMMLTHTWGGIY